MTEDDAGGQISALLANSLCWDDSATRATQPAIERDDVEQESFAWQQLSQYGSQAEEYAMPFPWRRVHTFNGQEIEVPQQPRRLAPANRLQEIHGLAGAIGEQLGLAWTADRDVQRFVQTSANRQPEHQRLIQRALAELAGHFVLGASHSLANLLLRTLLLNPGASAVLNTSNKRAGGFPPNSDARGAWLTFSQEMMDNLKTGGCPAPR